MNCQKELSWEKTHSVTKREERETKQRGWLWAWVVHQLELKTQNIIQGRKSKKNKLKINTKKAALKWGYGRSMTNLAKMSWIFEIFLFFPPGLDWQPADKEKSSSKQQGHACWKRMTSCANIWLLIVFSHLSRCGFLSKETSLNLNRTSMFYRSLSKNSS